MKLLEDFFSTKNLDISDGETFFIYDLDRIEENVKALRSIFKTMDRTYFSVKSNPSPIILKKLDSLDICFDVSTEKEMTTAFATNSDYSKITISGPAKTDAFIRHFSKRQVKSVHIDSKEEYELLKNSKVNLSVRWPLESTYSQKVGLPKPDLEYITNDAAKARKLSGIHVYIGRERAQADLVAKTLEDIRKFVRAHSKSFIDSPNLFWGGGLPLVNHLEPNFFPEDSYFRTHLECGRALVHNSGFYATQVLEIKEKADEVIVIINGGLQHLATHFGSPRYGQEDVSLFWPFHRDNEFKSANIYGSLGTITDLLVRNINIPDNIKRGDWVVIGPAGAYGYSAGTNQFLGPHDVKEVFVEGGSFKVSESKVLNYLEAGVYETQSS